MVHASKTVAWHVGNNGEPSNFIQDGCNGGTSLMAHGSRDLGPEVGPKVII